MSDVINKTALEEELDTTIHIRCEYGPVHAGASITPVRNPLTREFPNCVRKVDKYGDTIFGPDDNKNEYFVKETDSFLLIDGKDFDLTNPIQRKQWEAIKFSPLIFDPKGKTDDNGRMIVEPSEKRPATAIFRVERIIDETRKRNQKSKDLYKALSYIYNSSADTLSLRALILGKHINGAFKEEIEEYMIDIAKSNPKKIIDLYEGDTSKYQLIFIYAKQKSILIYKNGLYHYNDNIIGRDSQTCIDYFKNPKNEIITNQILKEIKEASFKDGDTLASTIDGTNARETTLKSDTETLKNLESFEPDNLSNPQMVKEGRAGKDKSK